MSDDSPQESPPSPATGDGDRDPAAIHAPAGDGDGHPAVDNAIGDDPGGVADGEAAKRGVANSSGEVEGNSGTGGSDDAGADEVKGTNGRRGSDDAGADEVKRTNGRRGSDDAENDDEVEGTNVRRGSDDVGDDDEVEGTNVRRGSDDAGNDDEVEGTNVRRGSDDVGDDDEVGEGSVPWLYLAGLLVFLASFGAFLWDLATGHAIERSLVTNALGAIMLVAWAGFDSYRDPDSGVATRGGAVGTGLILVGIYLFAAGLVIAVTSLVHGRMSLGLAMVAGAVPLVLVGFLSYPTDGVLAGGEGDTRESGDSAAANGPDGDA